MLKAIFKKKNGQTIWGFGLSAMNVCKLQDGQPILFNLSSLGLPSQEVLIFYGATEEIMETELSEIIGTEG